MRLLLASTCLASTCLTSLAFMTGTATAETIVDAKRTTPISSSSAKAGAADDVRITAAGSVTPAGGTAVTLDSANKVTNEGTIQITNANGAIGIGAIAGGTGTITNAAAGKIIVDESYEPVDSDKDGDLDGPFATGSGRAGIRTAGAFTGTITNSGAITIEGNDSAGILLGGKLTGGLTTDGTISVTGDRSVGVRTGDITGPVRIAGTISARGKDAVAVAIGGDIAGALVVQGAIGATGYRATTAPTDVSKLDGDDLLQGGPALSIAGSVSGGVIFAVPPKDADPKNSDEDKDGIDDSKEGSAAVVSYGSAAAVQIGATDRAITLGPIGGAATGLGLVIDGGISGQGVYTGVGANGLVIGGLGGQVSISNGMAVNGVVQAIAVGASATAIRVGALASVPEIRVGGSVTAAGGGAAGQQSTAIQVDQGGSVTTIRVGGTVKATAAGNDGSATAILDRAGSITTIENSGAIIATGALATSDRNIALDLRANTSGVGILQTAAAGATAPTIQGDVLLGSGADVLDVRGGTVTGAVRMGEGKNSFLLSNGAAYSGKASFGSGADTLSLSGTSTFVGAADFGGGADRLVLTGTSRFSGTLANAAGLDVVVAGGLLDVTSTGRVAINSLALGAGGVLAVTVDTATKTATQYAAAGAVVIDKGARIAVRLTGVKNAEGRYTIISAGALSGAANLTAAALSMPFLYTSTLGAGATANDLALDIKRKTAVELGLNRSGTAAYDAIYAALGQDDKVGGSILNIGDGDAFRSAVAGMLPNDGGGVFEAVTAGSRAMARMLADGGAPYSDHGTWGYWLTPAGWSSSKKSGATAGYDVTGFGLSGGGEIKTKLGGFGLSLGYLRSTIDESGNDNSVGADQYELGAYWRGEWGGLRPYARVSAAHIALDDKRYFNGANGTETVSRKANGDWSGKLYSATGGVSYEGAVGRITFRPSGSIDYYRLNEDGYTETGGGKAIDLTVAKRDSDQLAGTAAMAVGIAMGEAESGWFHIEAEGGRRQILGGSLGDTRAHFAGGQDFTLVADERTDGWVGRIRTVGGTDQFRLGGEFSAEEQQGRAALALRVSLQIGM